MLTTRHDSFQHLSTRLNESLLEVTRHKSQKNKHQDRNMSKPKHDTRILCITRSINVCKQMIRFMRFFIVLSRFKKRRAVYGSKPWHDTRPTVLPVTKLITRAVWDLEAKN